MEHPVFFCCNKIQTSELHHSGGVVLGKALWENVPLVEIGNSVEMAETKLIIFDFT